MPFRSPVFSINLVDMVMRIPENLAPENYPLAWLADSWEGGGVLEYENVPAAAYLQELHIDNADGGPYLRFSSEIWLAKEPAGAVDKENPGYFTYKNLTKERLWSSATGYLRVNPELPEQEGGARVVEAMVATPSGNAQVWVGLIRGPQLQLATDAIARSRAGAELNAAKIMAGSVQSDLFYAYDMEAFGYEMRSYLAGRLSRAQVDFTDEK